LPRRAGVQQGLFAAVTGAGDHAAFGTLPIFCPAAVCRDLGISATRWPQGDLAVTIIVMGLGNFPDRFVADLSAIGVAAPVLLVVLRFLQGIGLGGEWGGAVLMVVENAPKHRRGLFGSMVQVGNPSEPGGDRHVSRWCRSCRRANSWRGMAHSVPDLRAPGRVGLWIRLRMERDAGLPSDQGEDEVARMPVLDVFKYHAARS